jgi:adenine-specific DNA-methyltransferase
MDKIEKGDALTKSKDLIAENIEKLKQLFPEVVAEGKIDFKVLQSVLGEEIEEGEEYYRFTWAGKSKARLEAHKPSTGTLRPAKDESANWDTTQNLYIEGDNLEVLKLLQKSYTGKVKMIYIDPPYNTGNDFVYKDDYKDNLKNYQTVTGQLNAEGYKTSTNTDTDGRYHSNWLNMMYPRLALARNLLKDDGVIFMSIDDNEVENLKKIGNEIFGEYNFYAEIVWQKKYAATNDAKKFSTTHDYILVYQKSDKFQRILLPRTEEQNKPYRNDDNDGKGLWRADNILVKSFSESGVFPIINPNTKEEFLPPEGSCWRGNRETIALWLSEGRIFFGKDGKGAPQLKRYLNEVQQGRVPITWWTFSDVGHNDAANKEMKTLFGKKTPFDTPKPTTLIQQMLRVAVKENDIVMDFFSGSASTAHAVFKYNLEKNYSLKFIQIQIPEQTEEKSEAFKQGYKNIADIGKERIRRAGKKIMAEKPLLAQELDLGFKVFKLGLSNIKGWDGNPENLQQSLYDSVRNIKEDRTEEDVLYEILLKYGLDLTLPIEEREIAGKRVFNIGLGAMFICLADGITSAVAEGIGEWKEELQPEVCRVIFKDTGFTDVEKTNSVQTLKRFGIQEVRSI